MVVVSVTSVPIGSAYASLASFKAWMGVPDSKTDKDAEFQRRLNSSASDINRWCHRQFGRDEVASVRTFRPDRFGVDVHDFWTDEDLAITPYLGQTAGTAWDVSTLVLEPLDGIVDMVPGWPFNRISTLSYGVTHPLVTAMFYTASTLQISARWGWADVPENVETANMILASSDNKSKDAPFGVAAFGDYAVRIRSNPIAQEKLEPYIYRGTAANSYMVAS